MAPLPRKTAHGRFNANTATEPFIESTIVLTKSTTGLGLEIVGGADTYLDEVVVCNCEPNGVAENDGRLQVGDQILAVNGVSLAGMSHKEAVSALRIASSPVRLRVLRENPEEIFTTTEEPKIFLFVEITKSISDYLGLSILARRASFLVQALFSFSRDKKGVFVTYVAEGSLADIEGTIQQGDRILEVNGEGLRTATQEQASLMLRHCFGKVKIKIGRIPSLMNSIREEDGKAGYTNYAVEEEQEANPKILRRTSSYGFEKFRSKLAPKDLNRNLNPGENRSRSRSSNAAHEQSFRRASSFQEPKKGKHKELIRASKKKPSENPGRFRYISPDRIEFTLSDNEDLV